MRAITIAVLVHVIFVGAASTAAAKGATEAATTQTVEKPTLDSLDKRLGTVEKKAGELERAAKADPEKSRETRLNDLQRTLTSADTQLQAITANTKSIGFLAYGLLLVVLGVVGLHALWELRSQKRLDDATGEIKNLVAEVKRLAAAAIHPPPVVARIDPESGPITGAQNITITGSNFQPGATVRLRGNFATGIDFRSQTELRAVTPPGSVGRAEVVVENPDGAVNATPKHFEYTLTPPVARRLMPSAGPAAAATSVTVVGKDFQTGAVVRLNGADQPTTLLSENELTVTIPAGNAGAVSVTVRNPDGQESAPQPYARQ